MSQHIDTVIETGSRVPRLIDLHVGARLKRLRKRDNLSATYLETKAGLTVGSVSKFENGSVTIKPLELFEISKILNVRLSYFYS